MSDFLTVERLGPQQSLTPEGFLVIRAVPLARTGPQLYSSQEIPLRGDASGRVIIDRLPADVFAPSTIASLNGKPVTLDHPDDDVTPANYRNHAVGHVINPRRGLAASDHLLFGDLIITDPDAIEAIRNRDVREVSVGYKADYQQTGAGRGRQTDIICNHLALVQDGRCGPACRIGDRAFYAKDQHMNNLGRGGKQAFLPGSWGRDQSAGTSQGTTGSATGGSPRRADRPPTPPSLRAGAFTTDQPDNREQRLASSYFAPSPERDGSRYAAARAQAEADGDLIEGGDGLIEGANKLQQFGEHLQGNDQEEDPDQNLSLGQVIASLDDPGSGMVYRLRREDDGSISIVICPDTGEGLDQNKAMMTHNLGDAANIKFNRRLNGIHKQYWKRSTKDWASTTPVTLFRHKNLAPGERLELQGPDAYQGYSLVLFTNTKPLLAGDVPPATGNRQQPNPGTMKPAQAWAAAPGKPPNNLDIHELTDPIPPARTGDSRRMMTEPQRLASMNKQAAAFWRRSA